MLKNCNIFLYFPEDPSDKDIWPDAHGKRNLYINTPPSVREGVKLHWKKLEENVKSSRRIGSWSRSKTRVVTLGLLFYTHLHAFPFSSLFSLQHSWAALAIPVHYVLKLLFPLPMLSLLSVMTVNSMKRDWNGVLALLSASLQCALLASRCIS